MTTHVPFDLRALDASTYVLAFEGGPLWTFRDAGRAARLAPGALDAFSAFDLLRWGAPLALAPQGRVVLHASAAKHGDLLVAFLGQGGAGKSTLAHALGDHGWEVLADDLLVCTDDGRIDPTGEARLRAWCRANARSIEVAGEVDFADLASRLENVPEKPVSLSALLFLGETRARANAMRFTRQSAKSALALLVEHGYGGLPTPSAWRHQFDLYAQLAERVPTFRLTVPEGLDVLRAALGDFEVGLADALVHEN